MTNDTSAEAVKVGHTPGPWLVEGSTVYALEPVLTGPRRDVPRLANRFSASVRNDNSAATAEEIEANARLIAAAPDMDEAIVAFLALVDRVGLPIAAGLDFDLRIHALRLAHAQATGSMTEAAYLAQPARDITSPANRALFNGDAAATGGAA